MNTSTIALPMPPLQPTNPIATLADLQDLLGHVPLDRIRFHPPPGTATEADVLKASHGFSGQFCELVEGVLVEKAMGYRESRLAMVLGYFLEGFLRTHDWGLVTGAQGTVRLFPGLVRIPDVAFTTWGRLPNRRLPDEPIPQLAPDLAVEILSRGNTAPEMQRKRQEYFTAGVRLVWEVDPDARTVSVYTAADAMTILTQTDVLGGGDVLPGFTLPLAQLFAELDRTG